MPKINVVYVAELEALLSQIQRICYFCGKPIIELNGKGKNSLIVHHVNGDDSDNSPENRVFSHHSCHTTYHVKLHPDLVEKFQKAGTNANKGKSRPTHSKTMIEWHKNHEHPMTGRKPSLETINKMKKGRQEWWNSLTKEQRSKFQTEKIFKRWKVRKKPP